MKKGSLWIRLGLLLIAAALCLAAYNIRTEVKGGENAQEALESLVPEIPEETPSDTGTGYPDYMLNPAMDLPVKLMDGRGYVGVITIPAISREMPVLGEWNYDNLRIGPCRYAGTAYQSGFVICAHNYRSHFGPIKNLKPGNGVRFTDIDGNVFHYTVADIEIMDPTAVEEVKTTDWDLSLFTCTLGGRTRVVVRCLYA